MLKITNINSKVELRYNINRIISLLGILSEPAKKVPIYLVDDKTIEKYSIEDDFYDEDCLKGVLKNFYPEKPYLTEENYKKLEEMLKKCLKKAKHQPVGIYSRDGFQELGIPGPAILISPEKCRDWARKYDLSTTFVFEKVLFHELGHAYLDVGNYPNVNKVFKNFFEEGLSNYLAITRFKTEEDIAGATILINDQSFEYRAGLFFYEYQYKPLEIIAEIGIMESFSRITAISIIGLWKDYKTWGDLMFNDRILFAIFYKALKEFI